jgi:pimeloyl-ACP methyl ester carboxylesterase
LKRAFAAIAAVLAIVGTATIAAALLLARTFRKRGLDPAVDREPDPRDLEIVGLDEGSITLRPLRRRVHIDPAVPGLWGIESERGFDQAGPVIEARPDGSVVREFRPVQGVVRPGDCVRLDPYAHPVDPAVAHGLHFEEVLIPARAGGFPAWRLNGEPGTWAIFVHGKGAGRREALRTLPLAHEAGLPSLVITYRNDEGAVPDTIGHYAYGATEWEELEAAVEYAIEHGANGVVIFGYSMGGAICMSFMRRSRLAEYVRGLVLDAPMLHLERAIAHGAGRNHIPIRFLAVSNRVTGRLYHLRWNELDYLTDTGHLRVPVLLFHGDEDTVVPVETSDTLASARPDIVTYHRVPGAGHVRSWNSDQHGYEQAVRDFLGRIAT